MLPCIFSLASSNERLTKVSTVTSYQLHPFIPLPCCYVSNHLLLSGFKECQAYHNSHSYQLPNHPCLSVCQHHSFSLWLQVMKDLLKFPQLPVTSYTFSSIVSMWSHHHYLSLASRNERLIKVSTVTSYQLHHFLPLPCHYASQSSITLWLQVMKDLLKFPQLPVTSYTLSSLYFATMSPHHLLMCSYYHSLSVSGFKEWKTYQSSHSY